MDNWLIYAKGTENKRVGFVGKQEVEKEYEVVARADDIVEALNKALPHILDQDWNDIELVSVSKSQHDEVIE